MFMHEWMNFIISSVPPGSKDDFLYTPNSGFVNCYCSELLSALLWQPVAVFLKNGAIKASTQF